MNEDLASRARTLTEHGVSHRQAAKLLGISLGKLQGLVSPDMRRECSRREMAKLRDQGLVPVSAWIPGSISNALTRIAQDRGISKNTLIGIILSEAVHGGK